MSEVFYSIIYPGIIKLKKESFIQFDFKGVAIRAFVADHINSLKIFDPFNGMKNHRPIQEKDYFPNKADGATVYARNNESQFYKLEMALERLPSPRVFYNVSSSHLIFFLKGKSENDFDFAEELIDYFIKIYRSCFSDPFISVLDSIPIEYLFIESGSVNRDSNGNFELSRTSIALLLERFYRDRPSIQHGYHADFKTFEKYLNLNVVSQEIEVIIKSAYEAFDRKNYKYALLDIWILVEQIVSKVIEEEKIKKGISKTKIKQYSLDVSISYLLNIELPILLSTFDYYKLLFEKIDKLRKLRNNVIHKGRNVSYEEAVDAIDCGKELHNASLRNFSKPE